MKRCLSFLLTVMLAMTLLSACSGTTGNNNAAPTEQTESPTAPSSTPESSPSSSSDNDGDTQTATVQSPSEPSADASTVYMTTDISSEGLMTIYEKLGFDATGKVAVKLSTGEPPNSNYLRPELVKDLIQSLNGTIVECNTAYGGQRASTAMHMQVAKDHGFTDIAEVDIMDTDGETALPVAGGKNLTENFVGSHFSNYDSFVVLSHFKGHQMAGYGGAIKNISIGIASRGGKSWIHTAGTSKDSPWGGAQDPFFESVAEAGKAVSDSLDGKIVYVNVMNRLSIDCDCNGNPAEPDMHDVGILASFDPVALDKACVDICRFRPGREIPDGSYQCSKWHTYP